MSNKKNVGYVVVGVIVAILVLGGVAMLSMNMGKAAGPGAKSPVPAKASEQEQPPADGQPPAEVHTPDQADVDAQRQEQEKFLLSLAKRNPEDMAAIGKVDAPVVMIQWSDYRCPFCSAFNENTLPKLQKYVDDGTLRIEFRDNAVFGEDSVYAAIAARAAGDQGRYTEFMSALFAALPNEGHPPVDEALVVKIAEEVEVGDIEKFKADLQSNELRMAVQSESYEAQQLGLSSVPAFVVGSQYVAGAQPFEVFEQLVLAEAEKANQ